MTKLDHQLATILLLQKLFLPQAIVLDLWSRLELTTHEVKKFCLIKLVCNASFPTLNKVEKKS